VRTQAIVTAAMVVVSLASCAAGRMHWDTAWLALGAPSFILSGWMFVGHLVTLDDDSPKGFSNVEASQEVWRRSRIELAVKGVLFVFVSVAVLWGQT
jgi:hypothetical protein